MPKSFRDSLAQTVPTSPAMTLLNQVKEPRAEKQTEPKTERTRSADKETRSKRFNAIIKPSSADALRKIATMRQTSINAILNELIDEYITRNNETIKRYDSTFNH